MHTQRIFDSTQKIRLYDGYQGEEIIHDSREHERIQDILDDIAMGRCPESQRLTIPIRGREEVMKELGLK